MAWTRLDDQFFANPKVVDLSKDAKLVYLSALTYAASQLTDGHISPGALRIIAATVDADTTCVRELVTCGLWEIAGDGYVIHDFLDYNPTSAEIRARRQADRLRKRAGSNEGSQSDSARNPDGIATDSNDPVPTPVPTPVHEPTPAGSPRVSAREAGPNEAFETFVEGCELLGVEPSEITGAARTKQIGAIKTALKDAWPTDVLGCLGWLLSDDWRRERGVDFVTVRDNVPKWILSGRPAAVAPRNSPNGVPDAADIRRRNQPKDDDDDPESEAEREAWLAKFRPSKVSAD